MLKYQVFLRQSYDGSVWLRAQLISGISDKLLVNIFNTFKVEMQARRVKSNVFDFLLFQVQ